MVAIKVHVGDITKLRVDAIVNAANESLLGGGGVDGAIHQAAGPKLLEASRQLAPCPAGEARITDGYRLPAKYVIHTVGPIFQGGDAGESETLANAYRASLQIACERELKAVAFPCISTGVYGFPSAPACEIAIATVRQWLKHQPYPREVTFCCFNEQDAALYRDRLRRVGLLSENEEV